MLVGEPLEYECMCVCVCMYVCMYICMYVCMCPTGEETRFKECITLINDILSCGCEALTVWIMLWIFEPWIRSEK